MKYKDFKKALDAYFKDDDEIYPHAGMGCVLFTDIYHGQEFFKVDKADMDFEFIDCRRKPKEEENEDDSQMDGKFAILLSYDGEFTENFMGSTNDRLDAIRLCRECLGSTDPKLHGYVYAVDESCGENVDGSQISF